MIDDSKNKSELTERDKRFVELYKSQELQDTAKIKQNNRKKAYQPYLAIQKLVPAIIEFAEKNLPPSEYIKIFDLTDKDSGKKIGEIVGWRLQQINVSEEFDGCGFGTSSSSVYPPSYECVYLLSNGKIRKTNGNYDFFMVIDYFDYMIPFDESFSQYNSDRAQGYLYILKKAAANIFGMTKEQIKSAINQENTI